MWFAVVALLAQPHCVWQIAFSYSQLSEWIGHPQIPCIVKLPHALLVPTAWMYTLKIEEHNQPAWPALCHEIRSSSSFGVHTSAHTMLQFRNHAICTSMGLSMMPPPPPIYRDRARIVKCNIWPHIEHVLCGVSSTSCALGRDTSDWTLLYWVSL